jgi:hypothetical protein
MNWTAFDDTNAEVNDTTATKATSTVAVDNNFITNDTDWVENSAQDGNNVDDSGAIRSANWSQTDGSSICPVGFRVPTKAEFEADTSLDGQDWSSESGRIAGFNNFLKLPAPGYRKNTDGSLGGVSRLGLYWSGSNAQRLYLNNADIRSESRAFGFSVRCIKD